MKKIVLATIMLSSLLLSACLSNTQSQSFSEAHDAFETKLTKQWNNQEEIPEPPAGVFNLDYYDSKVGKLATYVSSDPNDGGQHPMIIWVVGGWGNSIDEFPWSYGDWDNDQTAAAFREAGILMMYPSFRGGNGNPGHYEALFGEVDDIVSAYEYAASLPYVDENRIYLGGHSTGGTRVLLASEYTDKFRAVFSFGPVDDVKYHNNSQFTFDTNNKDEYKMRSPIHWLQDIKSPTFIIEGAGGNASNLKRIQNKSENDNIYCYIVDGADHFSVLAPVTRLIAEKILADTGVEPNITLTKDELQDAMEQTPVVSYPVVKPYVNETFGFSMEIPAIWGVYEESSEEYIFFSVNGDDNFWDETVLFVDIYNLEGETSFDDIITEFIEDFDYQGGMVELNGQLVYLADVEVLEPNRAGHYAKVVAFQRDNQCIRFWFYVSEDHQENGKVIISNVIDSIVLE